VSTPDLTTAPQAIDPTFENVWDEIVWRGLVHVSTDQEALRALLAGDPVTYYCGFDPTAPSLHLGHLVQLLLLRRLQLAGHKPLGLVGGSTGLIGDPRPTAERTLNTRETVAEWVERLRGQVERYLSFEGENAARMVNNLDWTAPLSAIDFLREIGKHYRVGTMLKKDAVAARLNSDAGISYTEFSYMLLQAYDFEHLYRHEGVTLQMGGSDQFGNIVSGAELIRRRAAGHAYAVTCPLLMKADGEKFGKSHTGAVWLGAHRTSPYAFHQFWLNADDADVERFLKIFTLLPRPAIEEILAKHSADPGRRGAQRILADRVTDLVHGPEARQRADEAGRALFSGDVANLDPATLREVFAEVPSSTRDRAVLEEAGSSPGAGAELVGLLVDTGLAASRRQAREFLDAGSISINGRRVGPDHQLGVADLLHGDTMLLRRPRKQWHVAIWERRAR